MKKISDLKQGDTIYDIAFRDVKWYTYFCIHPNNNNYHILMDAAANPIKIYKDKLQDIINQGFETYDDVLLELAHRLKQDSDYILETIKQDSNDKL